jgi:photosystem II stability/assembly factor-like uncharacterized protein
VTGIETSPAEYYMGATGGGVWKTTNYGQSWKNVSDGFFETGSIGAIRVAQSNPDIVYVGTGSDGIRSNVIIGKGMYKSSDAGKTWEHIGLRNAGQIGAVEIHPDNADICYVAAIGNPFGANPERGVFKTTDGGKSWTKVLFISDQTGACDLEICPDDPNVIYASAWTVDRKPWTIDSGSEAGGVYKSTDAGATWTKLGNGLPTGIIGKSDLAVCLAEPGFLYVLMEAEKGQNGLYLSEDYGENFSLISNNRSLLDRPFYYCNVDVDPTNPNVIYVNTTGCHKSTNRGKNWGRLSTPHGDNHDMWINPSDPDLFIQSNDGGANVTRDGGDTWSPQNNQPTAELYQVDIDDQFPYWLYAGQQDNSTLAIPSTSSTFGRRGANNFISVGGCETGPAVPKPGNHNIVYANCKGRFGVYNKITGVEQQYYVGAESLYGFNPKDMKYRFQRVAPIYVSPHNPDVVYHGSQYLHKTVDDGVTWETISPDLTAFTPETQVASGRPITRDITGEEYYSTLYTITESKLKEGLIWVGANDGPIHMTEDGGKSWTNVTPADLPPGGRVQTVEASPHNPAKAYAAVLRYQLDDFSPHIYKTEDYGNTWTRISTGENGIPNDHPTRVIREDPDREGLLYAGTEFGLFISFDDGANWHSFQQNLPVVPVTDIKIHQKDLVLSTMGRSFWILDNISPLHEISIDENRGALLFTPKIAYRSRDTRGATIDYFLPDTADSIQLLVKNKSGKLVATLGASSSQGFHRINWGLTEAAASPPSGRGRSFGPKVVPDEYLVELTVDDASWTKKLAVLPDPRMVEAGMSLADYQEQYDLCIEVGKFMDEARAFQTHLDQLIKEIDEKEVKGKRKKEKSANERSRLEGIRAEMVNESGPYPENKLMSQISYLYSMISRADQRPGKDAYVRLQELTDRLDELKLKL